MVGPDLHIAYIFFFIILAWVFKRCRKKYIPVSLRPRVGWIAELGLSKERLWVFKMPPAERLQLPAHLVWFSLEAPDSSGC